MNLYEEAAMQYILRIAKIFIILLIAVIICQLAIYIYVDLPLTTNFYSSIPKEMVQIRQRQHGIKTVTGNRWIHLGWIADPDNEEYIIEIETEGSIWKKIGTSQFGSFLYRGTGGTFRVVKINKKTKVQAIVGYAKAFSTEKHSPIYRPVIASNYRPLFKPQQYGNYINDHTVFKDKQGNYHCVGITSKTDGNPDAEVYFAVSTSKKFPPENMMKEEKPIADVGDLAWAPHVIQHNSIYHMFWSPHRLHHMTSHDGIHWENHSVIMDAPFNKFFRDCMILQVAHNQWLMYVTARSTFFSQIDVYQSFNLVEWQYIRTALSSGWGSERNSPFASMESPFVVEYDNGYYLSFTYNNGTLFIHGLLLLFKVWPDVESYNDTLVVYSDNPYDFGIYRGKKRTKNLIAHLHAHAPEWIYVPQKNQWYITTCGWKWVATLTHGEVAIAPVKWQMAQ